MPNNVVFNLEPEKLRTQIFGNQAVALAQTADGLLQIASISDVVNVTATNLDIRDLTLSDHVMVYGSQGAALAQTADGLLQIASISDVVNVMATNLDIRDLTLSDHVTVYGSQGAALAQTADGLLQIASISDVVNVTATNLDIRDLTLSDHVRVYGSADAPLAQDGANNLQTNLQARGFTELSWADVATSTAWAFVPAQDTSQKTKYTFAVYNKGGQDASIRIETSPDANIWYIDTAAATLAAGTIEAYVARVFMKYTRIAYSAPVATTLDIFFNAQV
ncbi:MAG: hypothetical protein H5U00_01130 [Clostridia bacterium]|nr:hypothetical protein [Clostridia bacterium]